jgi:hypothetical protein
MPNHQTPSVTMSLADLSEYTPPAVQTVDLSEWTFNFVRGHEYGVAGRSEVDLEAKTVTIHIPHGLIIDTSNIDEAVNLVNFTSSIQSAEEDFTVDTSFIFNCNFNTNERITCANYAISNMYVDMITDQNPNIESDGHVLVEPKGLKFEWPNKTNVNICTELSEFAPVGCNYDGRQFVCEMYRPDIRDISLITSQDGSLHVYVRHLRVGLGDLLIQVLVGPQDESVKAFIFGPPALEKSHISYLDDIDHVIGDYHYGDDFYEASQAFVNDLVEEATKSEAGEITVTDLTNVNPKMEYFEYVSIR